MAVIIAATFTLTSMVSSAFMTVVSITDPPVGLVKKTHLYTAFGAVAKRLCEPQSDFASSTSAGSGMSYHAAPTPPT